MALEFIHHKMSFQDMLLSLGDDMFNLCLLFCCRRWKGENVATSEVADILTMAPCILEANVYGVKVEGKKK